MTELLIIITLIGVLSVIAGLMMLFNPELLAKWGEVLNRVLVADEIFYRQRNILGVLLVLAGIYLFHWVYTIYTEYLLI